ncbi:glycosyltransferase family 4 protein [Xanthobacter autotrophicus]|uniref:glycosyltransferase family 4 protein n=1 Tax=Xanthobacter autotrophicus TaxID=280 RepID=UPI00372B58D1
MTVAAPGTALARPIFINGRFLGRPVTGVERFAGMLLREIDGRADHDRHNWQVVAPRSVARPAWLKHLAFTQVGRLGGHGWEQTELAWAARNGTLVSLCNSGPVLHPRQLVVIHDALVYRYPENFAPRYVKTHQFLGRLLARRARLGTVSAFSQRELCEVLHLPDEAICIIPNAADHGAAITPDPTILHRLGLEGCSFLLFVGSPAQNKNLAAAVRAFLSLAPTDAKLVITGDAAKVFAGSGLGTLPDQVMTTGRLTDEEVWALYGGARALVFPSLYEGFGIPPLEAMSLGCPVLAADIPPVREVCADAALYFDPNAIADIAGAMRAALSGELDVEAMRPAGESQARLFSWHASADRLIEAIDHLQAH